MAKRIDRAEAASVLPDSTAERVIAWGVVPAPAELRWDQGVFDELASLPDVRCVFVTDRTGTLIRDAGRARLGPELCAQLDLTVAAIEHAGQALSADEIRLVVSTFRGATWIAHVTPHCHAGILADPGGNLGQLLSYMRRIIPDSHD